MPKSRACTTNGSARGFSLCSNHDLTLFVRNLIRRGGVPGSTKVEIKRPDGKSYFDRKPDGSIDDVQRGKDIENHAAGQPAYNNLTQTADGYQGVDFVDEGNKKLIQMFSTRADNKFTSIQRKINHFLEKTKDSLSGKDIDGKDLIIDPNKYSKILDVVIQKGKTTNEQFNQIQRAIRYGREVGVEVRIVEIP